MIQKILYASSRYASYGLKFLQTLLVAKLLGPAGLAILGFSQLISLYVSFFHFGIPLSINTLLSIAKGKDEKTTETFISDGFWFLLLFGILFTLIGGLAIFFSPSLFEKFEFSNYGVLSIVIGVNLFIVQYFSNIYQVYGFFLRVALNDLATIIMLFAVLFLFKESSENLLFYFLLISAVSIVFNLFFFLFKAPFKIEFQLRKEVIVKLIKIGIPLLISTVGFYLITISVRSITNYFYSLEEIGLFTFGLSISNAVMLGLNAVSWTFYPTILANTSGSVVTAAAYIRKLNVIFNTILTLTIFSGIFMLPALFYFVPEYEPFADGMAMLLLAQLFTSLSFGYSTVLIAQRKEKKLAIVSLTTLAFVLIVSFCIGLLGLPFVFQTLAILIAMVIYSMQIIYLGSRITQQKFFHVWWSEILSPKIGLTLAMILAIVVLKLSFVWVFLPMTLVLIFSYRQLLDFFGEIVKRKAVK